MEAITVMLKPGHVFFQFPDPVSPPLSQHGKRYQISQMAYYTHSTGHGGLGGELFFLPSREKKQKYANILVQ